MLKVNLSGKRIKETRRLHRLGQVDLSAALDLEYNIKLTQSDISEIERGVRGIKDTELHAIALILEVDPTWLIRGKN